MTDSMELKNVFYACVIPFLIFFTSFALFIYPNRAVLHPHGLVDLLAARLPANFAAPLSIVRNWSFALFYVMAGASFASSSRISMLASNVPLLTPQRSSCRDVGQRRRIAALLGLCK